jgi:hypothetical protein
LNIDASTVTIDDEIFFADLKELKFGNTSASPDLKIYHQNGNNFFEGSSSIFTCNNFRVRSPNNDEAMISATANGAVNLYYDSGADQPFGSATPKLATTSSGVAIDGTITAGTFGTSSQNAYGARTVGTGTPTGGSNGDIYYKY